MSSDKNFFLTNASFLLTGEKRKAFMKKGSLSEKQLSEILEGNSGITLDVAMQIAEFLGLSLDVMIAKDLTKRRSDIKFLVLDVDGVLTEGGMYYTQSGDEFKRFHTRDGMALKKLTKSGFQVAFLSSGINEKLVRSRAALLGVQKVYVGLDAKLWILQSWKDELNLDWNQIAYIGDDVNDIEVMKLCGFNACPADAVLKVRSLAHVVLSKDGGHGCVREFIEDYLIDV